MHRRSSSRTRSARLQIFPTTGCATITSPIIISRSDHTISRANIGESALKVLYRLKNAGYQAYLVGGGVRDLLLGREPKDFDVATDAHPEDVRRVFRNCRLIGRRFRLAHVHFGRDIVEVATFRAGEATADGDDRELDNGRLLRDNVYGTLEEDAWRRDFSVNALYYNIEDFSILDYTGGLEDLKDGRLRLIGDPDRRYREDPVRMLRAARFAAKLGFRIDPHCEQPLFELSHLLEQVPAARLFDEVLKLFLGGTALQTFELLRHYGLFGRLFPETESCLSVEDQGFPITLVAKGLENTDNRVREDKPVTPAFLFAVLLWEPVRRAAEGRVADGMTQSDAIQQAGETVLARQVSHISIPRRFSLPMREIWNLQHRFDYTSGKRPMRLALHPRFRAAYDFLLLRSQAGEVEPELAEWWTRFQEVDETAQRGMISEKPRPRRRRRRRPKALPE